jgi:hypothetical protein
MYFLFLRRQEVNQSRQTRDGEGFINLKLGTGCLRSKDGEG